MALNKLAIYSLIGIGSVVAVGSISAAIVVSSQDKTQTINDNNNKQEESVKPQSNETKSDNAAELTTAQTVLNSITKDSLVIVNNKNNDSLLNPSEIYAFDLTKNNIKFKNQAIIPKGFEVDFDINKKDNSATELNDGKLTISVIVKQTSENKQAKSLIKLDGFKTSTEKLKKLLGTLKTDESELDEKSSLTLIPKNNNQNEFVSIEKLNSSSIQTDNNNQTGLNDWLAKSSINETELKDLKIQGEIKLEKIKKIDGKTYFILCSKNKNKFLKITNKANEQILISHIKTTNLLASDITVLAKQTLEKQTTEFTETLAKLTDVNKYETSNKNLILGRNLSINVPKQEQKNPSSQVFIKPYVTNFKQTEENDVAIDLCLSVIFGNDQDAKVYDLSNQQEAKELEDASFSFHLYSRKQEKSDMKIGANDLLNSDGKLEAFFKNENYIKPTNKPKTTSNPPLLQIENSNFTLLGPIAKEFDKSFKLDIKKDASPQNYVLFADYSYIGATNMNQLSEKILFTPSLTLLHIQSSSK